MSTSLPAPIRFLCERFQIPAEGWRDESHFPPDGFFRYGRKRLDALRYRYEDGRLTALCIRHQKITDTDWLGEPEFSDIEELMLGENEYATTELELPAGLARLRRFDLSDCTGIRKLILAGPAARLERIEGINSSLRSIDFPETGCPTLQYLDCTRSQLRRLKLHGSFPALHSIHLRDAKELRTLRIDSAPLLDTLELTDCVKLERIPREVIMQKAMEQFYAANCAPKNCPASFLMDPKKALGFARTWFRELENDPSEPNRFVKLLINGNGGVGKTTLWCALKNTEDHYCPHRTHETTHGIELTVDALDVDGVKFRGWDFGGQETYRGTHRLFYSDGAVNILAIDKENEEAARLGLPVSNRIENPETGEDGTTYNDVLDYFYQRQSEVNRFGRFVLVQTKCDSKEEEHPHLTRLVHEERLPVYHIDSKEEDGRVRKLREELVRLARELPTYEMEFPATWLAVRDWLKANLSESAPVRAESGAEFRRRLVRDHGVTDDPVVLEALIHYLHATGDIYRIEESKEENTIILDLRWALKAIYRPMDRATFARNARDKHGKVYTDEVFPASPSNGPTYTEGQQRTLLSFMQSCGLCFVADPETREYKRDKLPEQLIFPQYLPEQCTWAVRDYWEDSSSCIQLTATLPFRDISAMHALICDLGRKTSEDRRWRTGIDFYLEDIRELKEGEQRLSSVRAMVELVPSSADQQGAYSLQVLLQDKPGAAAWIRPLQSWIGERFGELEWTQQERAQPVAEAVGRQEAIKLDETADSKFPVDLPVYFMYANPPGTVPLHCRQEFDRLIDYRNKHRDSFRLLFDLVGELTYTQLDRSLMDRNHSIVHFSGHGVVSEGNQTGGLVVHNQKSSKDVLTARELKALFESLKKYNPDLRLLVLNACFSKEQAVEISKAGLYVVGTTCTIDNEAAIQFSIAFYRQFSLSFGRSKNYHSSIVEAMAAGYRANIREYGTRPDVYQIYFNGKNIPY